MVLVSIGSHGLSMEGRQGQTRPDNQQINESPRAVILVRGNSHPSLPAADIWQCLGSLVPVTTWWKEVLLASNGWRPEVPLIYYSMQNSAPLQRITWPNMPTVPRVRNPDPGIVHSPTTLKKVNTSLEQSFVVKFIDSLMCFIPYRISNNIFLIALIK